MPYRNSRGTSTYRYGRPTISQYESFFNPIPLEFLQQQFDRRQGTYDASFAGALAAQDQLAQMQVGMADLADKNRIIQEGMQNIDKMVAEKYGGDWGKASKAVARDVTAIRQNPFWNAQKEAQKQRDIAQELKIKYGSNAFIFNDPTQLGVLDEEGKVRDLSTFQPDIVQKGDWVQTARQLMAGLTPDQNPYGLTEAEIEGFVKYGTFKGITKEKIERFASDPAVQNALLSAHPEIRRGISELDERQQRQFGLYGKTAEQVAQEQLLGAGASAESRQVQFDYRQDAIAVNAAENRAKNVPMTPTTNASEIVGNVYEGQLKRRNINFNSDGSVRTGADRIKNRQQPSAASMMPVLASYAPTYGIDFGAITGKGTEAWRQLWDIARATPPSASNPLGTIAAVADNVGDFMAGVAEQKDLEYVNEIRRLRPELADYTDQQAVSMYESADEKLSKESSTLYNYGIDWQEAETINYVYDPKTKTPGRMFQQELYLDGSLIAGEDKEKRFAKELGYKLGSETFNDALNSSRISDMSFTGNTPSEQVMVIKDNKGNNRTVEIAPHRELQELGTPSWVIAEFTRSGGQSNRLQDYTVGGQAPSVDEQGNLVVPVRAAATIDGKQYPVFYHVDANIVPTDGTNEKGEYNLDIKQIVYREDGQPYVINEGMELQDVINFDKAQVQEWIKVNRTKRQSGV